MLRRVVLAGVGALGLAWVAGVGGATETAPARVPAKTEVAVFAGGCFWCVESDFDKVPGVVDTVSGYAGGRTKNPDYKSVSAGGTGHLEVVKVTFDPEVVSYRQLVDYFWRTVNPTDAGGQFCDRGESYQTAIFAQDEAQKKAAEESKAALEASKVLKWPVVTPVRVETQFWPAEDYHQNYYQVNSLKYKYYRYGCGRDARLKELWGDTAGKFAGS